MGNAAGGQMLARGDAALPCTDDERIHFFDGHGGIHCFCFLLVKRDRENYAFQSQVSR